MVVCAHGEVAAFCETHEMQILEKYEGDLGAYAGNSPVIVTDQKMTRQEYDALKCALFGRGVELVSTEWTDDEVILRLLWNQIDNRGKRGGRQMFGFHKRKGMIVEIPEKIEMARMIIKLRDSGKTLREICEVADLSMSTVQTIIKNREAYER